MPNTITVPYDGRELTVDLARVSLLDAMVFRATIGEDLSDWLTDLPTLVWLWTRQNLDPMAQVAPTLASLALVPEMLDEPAPPEGAG